MTDSEIKALLQPFIKSYESGNLLPKKCIRLHFDLITKINGMGIGYKKIVSISGFPMGAYSFTNRMYEIRKERGYKPLKVSNSGATSTNKIESITVDSIEPNQVLIESNLENNLHGYSIDDWRSAFGFYVNDEMTEDFAHDFGEMGLNPKNWQLYKDQYNIFNAKRLASVHANRKAHKFIER
ncbi:hypothetical protein ACTTZI_004217 [Vibrio vulnificus]